ncbi:hypothetical protein GF312_11880 [Candidatus Poribacteria bacterium]|nr:hypothetical protein [Candidatus Poribacteria bacterium]
MKKTLITITLILTLTSSVLCKEPPEKCGECHSDSLAYKEWEKSDHAISLKTLLKDQKSSKKTSCLKCHSVDYVSFSDSPWASRKNITTPETATNPVSCSACHKHDSGFEHNLNVPAEKLCISCHIRFCGG